MIYNFKSFNERKDIELHNHVEDLTKKLLSLLNKQYSGAKIENNPGHNQFSSKFKNTFTGQIILPIHGFVTPFYICFSDKFKNPCFGSVSKGDGEIPAIIFPSVDLTKKWWKFKKQFDIQDIVDSINRDYYVIFHEMIHYVDFLKRGYLEKTPKVEENISDYFNHYHEQNAYFMQGTNRIIKIIKSNKKILSDFYIFKENFISDNILWKGHINHFYEKLTPENKKRIDKRIYDLYITSKEING
jgi:hypothetical protein